MNPKASSKASAAPWALSTVASKAISKGSRNSSKHEEPKPAVGEARSTAAPKGQVEVRKYLAVEIAGPRESLVGPFIRVISRSLRHPMFKFPRTFLTSH